MSPGYFLWPRSGLAGIVHAGPLTYSVALDPDTRRAPDLPPAASGRRAGQSDIGRTRR